MEVVGRRAVFLALGRGEFYGRHAVYYRCVMKVQTKSKKVNKAWLNDHVTDPYVQMAQKEGFRSRAAYKLKEIDETFQLIRPGQVVVDLGSAPGAWSQYVRQRFAPKGAGAGGAAAGALNGSIVALDLLPMESIEGVHFLQGDFREQEVLDQLVAVLAGRAVDLVFSDMSPNLSGIADTDAARVEHLVELAIDFARSHLRPNGALVCKVFHSGGYDALVQAFRSSFRVVKAHKPKASRDRSAETFLVGIGLKRPA
jgi:23S rRNA (uridine2552-2'-O)-methyltransferase